MDANCPRLGASARHVDIRRYGDQVLRRFGPTQVRQHPARARLRQASHARASTCLNVTLIEIIVPTADELIVTGITGRSGVIFPLKVSIITAVYNGESEIVRTLDSVAAQDYRDIEHLVIDGDSRDATIPLVRQHGLRVSQCISEPDRGVYDAFNKDLRVATGDVIAFLNAGDTYLD